MSGAKPPIPLYTFHGVAGTTLTLHLPPLRCFHTVVGSILAMNHQKILNSVTN